MRFAEQDFAREFSGFRDIAPCENFKNALENYQKALEKTQGEVSLVANALKPFFEQLGFETLTNKKIKGNSTIDLALLESGETRVIIEAKEQKSKEFPSRENLNCKAFRQGLLYLWREIRGENESGKENRHINFVVLTNFFEFYIFEARELQEKILKHPKIKRFFEDCSDKKPLAPKSNEEIYPEIDRLLERHFVGESLRGIHFDLRDKKSRALAAKALSATFLLQKEPQGEIGERFYTELLYILGLRRKLDSKGNKTNKLEPNDAAGAGSFYAQVAAKVVEKLENGGGGSDSLVSR